MLITQMLGIVLILFQPVVLEILFIGMSLIKTFERRHAESLIWALPRAVRLITIEVSAAFQTFATFYHTVWFPWQIFGFQHKVVSSNTCLLIRSGETHSKNTLSFPFFGGFMGKDMWEEQN